MIYNFWVVDWCCWSVGWLRWAATGDEILYVFGKLNYKYDTNKFVVRCTVLCVCRPTQIGTCQNSYKKSMC